MFSSRLHNVRRHTRNSAPHGLNVGVMCLAYSICVYRLCSCRVRRRSRSVPVLHSEQSDILFVHEWHEWFSVEMEWSERVLCEKEFNAADHHRREHWQRVSTVHCQWRRCTERFCLAWRSSCEPWCQVALDQQTQVRLAYAQQLNQLGWCMVVEFRIDLMHLASCWIIRPTSVKQTLRVCVCVSHVCDHDFVSFC